MLRSSARQRKPSAAPPVGSIPARPGGHAPGPPRGLGGADIVVGAGYSPSTRARLGAPTTAASAVVSSVTAAGTIGPGASRLSAAVMAAVTVLRGVAAAAATVAATSPAAIPSRESLGSGVRRLAARAAAEGAARVAGGVGKAGRGGDRDETRRGGVGPPRPVTAEDGVVHVGGDVVPGPHPPEHLVPGGEDVANLVHVGAHNKKGVDGVVDEGAGGVGVVLKAGDAVVDVLQPSEGLVEDTGLDSVAPVLGEAVKERSLERVGSRVDTGPTEDFGQLKSLDAVAGVVDPFHSRGDKHVFNPATPPPGVEWRGRDGVDADRDGAVKPKCRARPVRRRRRRWRRRRLIV